MILAIVALCGLVAVPLYNGNVSGPIAENSKQIVQLQQSQIKQAEQTEKLIKESREGTQKQIEVLEKTLAEQRLASTETQAEVMRKIDVMIERSERTDATISSLRAFAENQGFQLRERRTNR